MVLNSIKIFGFILALSPVFNADAQHTLTVKVTAIESQKGVVEIGLFKDPSKFAKAGQAYKMVRIEPKGRELVYEFKDLAEKDYAICIYHDENKNRICDKNFFGIPTEAYAFSNNVRPLFSAPSFEQCSMRLNKDRTFSIKMVY